MANYRILTPATGQALAAKLAEIERANRTRERSAAPRAVQWLTVDGSGSAAVQVLDGPAGTFEALATDGKAYLVGGSIEADRVYPAIRSGVNDKGEPLFAVLADADQVGDDPPEYFGGLVSTSGQVFKGPKTFRDTTTWQEHKAPNYARVAHNAPTEQTFFTLAHGPLDPELISFNSLVQAGVGSNHTAYVLWASDLFNMGRAYSWKPVYTGDPPELVYPGGTAILLDYEGCVRDEEVYLGAPSIYGADLAAAYPRATLYSNAVFVLDGTRDSWMGYAAIRMTTLDDEIGPEPRLFVGLDGAAGPSKYPIFRAGVCVGFWDGTGDEPIPPSYPVSRETPPPTYYPPGPAESEIPPYPEGPSEPPPPPPPPLPPPAITFTCGPGDKCIDPGDGSGAYATYELCEENCPDDSLPGWYCVSILIDPYRTVDYFDDTPSTAISGPYETEGEAEAACEPLEEGFNCMPESKVPCVPVMDGPAQFATLEECEEECEE